VALIISQKMIIIIVTAVETSNLTKSNVLSCVRVLHVAYMTYFGLDLLHLIHSHTSGLQAIVLLLFYTHYSSPLHMHECSQSSLVRVVSRQWIYNSLTVTSNHT
jgi:hypothetical protein